MKNANVMKTRRLDLCTSCEICAAVCPVNAITMEYKCGQFLPKINDKKCKGCGLCLEICPGIDIDPLCLRKKEFTETIFNGSCIESYTAYSNDYEIRKNSTSGGLITTLIIKLIKDKEFHKCFVLNFNNFKDKPARIIETCEINKIISASKSKYIPASVYNIIITLKKKGNKKYLIVGTPCQIYGISKFIKKFNISDKNILFLGLFCDKTLNFNIIKYFDNIFRKTGENLSKFDFRNKQKTGWPGDSKIYFDSGREVFVDKSIRMQLKRFFQLNRCIFCYNKLNIFADISFGDCYLKGKGDFNGKSSVIVRTKKGKKIFEKYSYLFTLEKENIEKIRYSQHLIDRKMNLEYIKEIIKKYNLYLDSDSNYKINSRITREILKLQRYINWGKNYNIKKIKQFLFISRFKSIIRKFGMILIAAIALGIIIIKDLFIYKKNKSKDILNKREAKNIIIVGGELFNKGSQAMVFTVVDQIKRKFRDKDIYLFSGMDFNREEKDKNIYNFSILPSDIIMRIRFLNLFGKILKNKKHEDLEKHIIKIIKDTLFFIDISGYCLHSNPSERYSYSSFAYLLNIIIAMKYSVPYYIFPQSIGPFDYPIINKILLYPILKLYLKYPKKIYIREKEGLICLYKFTRKNVEISYDIVLQNKEYKLDNIYIKNIHFKNIKIKSGSVAIIPNIRVIERMNLDEIYLIYKSLINKLISAGKMVYILRHSYEDLNICEKIKSLFINNRKVILIFDDLNAIELENTIKQFDFLIASRYHAIIHSYKNGVPVLVIGWATKYFELLKNFDQLDYFFDCRNKINIDMINKKLDKMMQSFKYEKKKIIKKVNIIQEKNIFDNFYKRT